MVRPTPFSLASRATPRNARPNSTYGRRPGKGIAPPVQSACCDIFTPPPRGLVEHSLSSSLLVRVGREKGCMDREQVIDGQGGQGGEGVFAKFWTGKETVLARREGETRRQDFFAGKVFEFKIPCLPCPCFPSMGYTLTGRPSGEGDTLPSA